MAVQIDAATPDDLDVIAGLLTTAFGAAPDASFADRRLLRWKYFEPFGSGSVPRSFVLKQGGEIVAHCVAAPLTLCLPSTGQLAPAAPRMPVVTFMDWVAGPRIPGAGAILLKKLLARTDVAVVAAGSDATRQTMPKLGFALRDTLGVYARVVRPWRQYRTRPSSGTWRRDAAKLLRNTAWSWTPLGQRERVWRAMRVDAFTSSPIPDCGEAAVEHTADYLNYWLRCPAARVTAFEALKGVQPVGYFVIARVGGQARIAAIRLKSSSPDDWRQALRLAARTAADDAATCEVVCTASTRVMREALEACGFRRRDTQPLFLYDPRQLLGEGPIAWSGIDDDLAYVFDPASPYRT